MLADGTFKFCPKFYKQLYTLHQYVAGVYTPTAFFLLKNKRFHTWVLVPQAFEDYAKLAPSGLAKFLDYLRRTWMAEQSTFPPKLWAGAAQSNVPNTTHACESFHLHFGKLFNSPHPNIYVFFWKIYMTGQSLLAGRQDTASLLL